MVVRTIIPLKKRDLCLSVNAELVKNASTAKLAEDGARGIPIGLKQGLKEITRKRKNLATIANGMQRMKMLVKLRSQEIKRELKLALKKFEQKLIGIKKNIEISISLGNGLGAQWQEVRL